MERWSGREALSPQAWRKDAPFFDDDDQDVVGGGEGLASAARQQNLSPPPPQPSLFLLDWGFAVAFTEFRTWDPTSLRPQRPVMASGVWSETPPPPLRILVVAFSRSLFFFLKNISANAVQFSSSLPKFFRGKERCLTRPGIASRGRSRSAGKLRRRQRMWAWPLAPFNSKSAHPVPFHGH